MIGPPAARLPRRTRLAGPRRDQEGRDRAGKFVGYLFGHVMGRLTGVEANSDQTPDQRRRKHRFGTLRSDKNSSALSGEQDR